MSNAPSTSGIQLRNSRGVVAETVELLSSMRFAIAMFVIIIMAAVIGTIMQQNKPMGDYVNQFGPFWFDVFDKLGLYAIYSSWWFVSLVGLLVVSTSLCIVHNTPKMLKDMRSWREKVREQSLNNFHHKTHWQSPLARTELAAQTAQRLGHAGYAAKIIEKDGAVLVSAKRGAGNKFGYIFAHSAIVIILLGGMLDSDLPVRFQQWAFGKSAFGGTGLIADIPEQHRLGVHNPTYRGNIALPEGSSGDTALLPRPDGVLVQPLPITIRLKKFDIDFYSTGMPKLFASHVSVRSNQTGKTVDAVVEVNKPLIFEGVAIYQSDFSDGGSKLKLVGHPMKGAATTTFGMEGVVNDSTKLNDEYTVEWSDLRTFNVENIGSQDARAVTKGENLNESFARSLDKQLGSAAKGTNNKDLKNVGPSVQYKLRDKTGQAREYQNYMQPVTIEGDTVFLAGVRASPADPFSYLRIPADDEHSVREWMRLRAALQDPVLRQKAAERYAARAMPQTAAGDVLRKQLEQSSLKGLEIFAGDTDGAGFFAISRFLEKVPQAEQTKAAEIFLKILNGTMWELWQAAREKDGKPAVAADEAHGRFLQLATNALSDSFFYGAPVYLQLDEYTQVRASVFQVTRSPGKTIVYIGCLLLVLGVFAMFYIRERRVWVWIKDGEEGSAGAQALMAMSTQRKTLDFEKEFKELKEKLPQSA
jgi:cytochrome c biogenesis protein